MLVDLEAARGRLNGLLLEKGYLTEVLDGRVLL
jgi:hypothetical protein